MRAKDAAETLESRRLKKQDAAAYLGVSVRTLYNLPIRRIKVRSVNVWDTRDLDLYLGLNTIQPRKSA